MHYINIKRRTQMAVVNLKQPPREPNWRVGFIGGSDAVKIFVATGMIYIWKR